MTGLNIGDVVRTPGGHRGERPQRGLPGGRVSLCGDRRRRFRRGAVLLALLGLAVQIIGGDEGGRGFWPAGAKQRIGGDALRHVNHSSFPRRRTRKRAVLLPIYDSGTKTRQNWEPPYQLFSKMGLRKTE